MNMQLNSVLFFLFCYILGCISTGYYLVKTSLSKDIRDIGSKSTGATNVGRLMGKKGFYLTLILDGFKGILVALLCIIFRFNDLHALLSLTLLTCGHIWPIQLKFRGGKGISILFGFFVIWNFKILLLACFLTLLIYLIIRNFSISGLIALLLFPLYAWAYHFDHRVTGLLFLLICMVYISHRDNIQNYLDSKKR